MDNWQWYQWMMATMFFLSLGIHARKHGEKRDEKYNFFMSIMRIFLWSFLLWKGGFWK